MSDRIHELEQQLPSGRGAADPPLHLWNPPLSGDIDIIIRRDGSWWHEGRPIRREALVRLFAGILRREEDGEYYLVTPVEKWRVQVEAHALQVVDVTPVSRDGARYLQATLNTGATVVIGEDCPLFVDAEAGGAAGIRLRHGLSALLSRPAWYRLVELAGASPDGASVQSGDYRFSLAPEEG
jgi:hypothetical protein